MIRAVALVVLVGACVEDQVFVDPFPIELDTRNGGVIIGAQIEEDDTAARPVALDILSPFTTFEPGPDQLTTVQRRRLTITLFGRNDAQQITVPRAQFPKANTIEGRLCDAPVGECAVGLDAARTPIQGVVGADVIGRATPRFDFANRVLRFFPDVAGNDRQQGTECRAVFRRPYAGGGTLRVGRDDVPFVGVRPALGACLDIEGAPTQGQRGVDALFVLSTGIGPSIMSASSYDRYAVATGAPARDQLLNGTVFLPFGSLSAQVATIGQIALVGEESEQRGPCRELFANRVMSEDLCRNAPTVVGQCPCDDLDADFCRAGAAMMLTQPVTVAVVADEEPFLQGLREELRPQLADVDGILGIDAMAALEVTLDYSNNRLLMSCQNATVCESRPLVDSRESLGFIQQCLRL